MAIAGYVTINSKKYRVIASQDYTRAWEPPKTVRNGVLGNTIISQGPGSSNEMTQAVLAIDYTPASGYGALSDLKTAVEASYVSYTDHITSESVYGAGTFNITLLSAEIIQLSPLPSSGGYNVLVRWQKVLS